MTEERMALIDLLQKSEDGDFLRSVAEAVLQLLMEADVEGLIGAARHERTPVRVLRRLWAVRRVWSPRTLGTSLRIGLAANAGNPASSSSVISLGGNYPPYSRLYFQATSGIAGDAASQGPMVPALVQ